jgi:tRNA-specific 2-thiouridylase
VVEPDGTPVGEHDGAYGFTVGQRRGIRLGRPAADGRPRYVLDIRPETATVVVGPREALSVTLLAARRPTWCGSPPALGQRVGVQVRAHGEEVPGTLDALPAQGGAGEVRVVLDHPVDGVAPGQTMALYDGTRVVGAATLFATGGASGGSR